MGHCDPQPHLLQVDGLVSSAGSSEDMALVKKLNALEVENKQLKKGQFSILCF